MVDKIGSNFIQVDRNKYTEYCEYLSVDFLFIFQNVRYSL